MARGTWRVDPVENKALQVKHAQVKVSLSGNRKEQLDIHKKLYGTDPGLPADYGGREGTEAIAFEVAKKHNIETKCRTDLDMDLDKLY